ncbi:unnamed protein product, partial [Amoebophrya sp. A120]|eukprot:GSA120T00017042001.1
MRSRPYRCAGAGGAPVINSFPCSSASASERVAPSALCPNLFLSQQQQHRSIIVIAKKRPSEDDATSNLTTHPVLEHAAVTNRPLAEFLYAAKTVYDASRPELLHLWRLLGRLY